MLCASGVKSLGCLEQTIPSLPQKAAVSRPSLVPRTSRPSLLAPALLAPRAPWPRSLLQPQPVTSLLAAHAARPRHPVLPLSPSELLSKPLPAHRCAGLGLAPPLVWARHLSLLLWARLFPEQQAGWSQVLSRRPGPRASSAWTPDCGYGLW